MESTLLVEAGSEAQKRRSIEDCYVLKEASNKRIKGGVDGDVRRVAEMVLVLAAMGKMRGGRGPTDAEKELMAEARNRLVKVCEGFAPKDVFPRDAFGGVIEDLGLSMLKEQRLGFRPPKMSIAQKLLVSKRKAMWEDNHSSKKWVTVKRCYFPGDLPEAVGRPCLLESSEVYESTCDRTVMAGLYKAHVKFFLQKSLLKRLKREVVQGHSRVTFCLHFICASASTALCIPF
ncbi:UNVERIFIED_CONTAM: hypothetical protein Slati_4010400 [Sesamum latifolium]|uniref:DUF7797 domain-containing protein n=1 Tax=Sesamum latifolium TaxID=2727402 RepID=A0AAW2TR76_9LAMI